MQKGAVSQPIPIGQPRPLRAEDLERLKEPRFVAATPQKLRDSHHAVARLAATGMRPFKIAETLGYSEVRVRGLLMSPAMIELVAKYREKVDESFVESQDQYFELATRNMLAAERHIADHIAELEDQGELLPVRTALAVSRDAADRFGYGKKTQNLNINVDFAAQLEKAIARSGKTIEGVAARPNTPVQSRSSSPAIPTRSGALSAKSSPVDGPRPLIRRRA